MDDPPEPLVDRIRQLEDLLEIFGLEGRYGPAWDSADAEAWAGLFTSDGVFEMVSVGGEPATTSRGRGELREFCRRFTATTSGVHLLNLPAVTASGDTARARIHFTFTGSQLVDGVRRNSNVVGVYDVDYRRTDEGWLMARRVERAVQRERAMFYEY